MAERMLLHWSFVLAWVPLGGLTKKSSPPTAGYGGRNVLYLFVELFYWRNTSGNFPYLRQRSFIHADQDPKTQLVGGLICLCDRSNFRTTSPIAERQVARSSKILLETARINDGVASGTRTLISLGDMAFETHR